ncbi:hypothetical protein MKZ38_007323 [Zalerion maritima]|uniref:DUF676 domain-containing protein n=1 Tax=Zalerion maritima TaxID=339359 RepID=A0AAD5RIV3_9PEZI|nr:hypothetical protein MKZ38_007323 [Zalerion maritima]
MKKTLLLCFIHGFKGGESTFGHDYQFTKDLRNMVASELPKIDVKVLVYPKYETRGNLGEAVSRFRDWLQEKIIDMEVEAGTQSPTVDPSIHTILLGHSMGGIVAAETVMVLTSDKPIPHGEGGMASQHFDESDMSGLNTLMFPYVQGVLAFDTPYLGIAPGVVAHGAEGHYNAFSQASAQLSGLAGLWGGSNAASPASSSSSPNDPKVPAALPAPESTKSAEQAKKSGGGGGWGKFATFAGAGAALAGAGAAAYLGRGHIAGAAGWAGSHLEFVGCLAKGSELRRRVGYMARVSQELNVGFANLYTKLGTGVSSSSIWTADGSLGGLAGQLASQRTFCNLPSGKEPSGTWKEAVNDKAGDEAGAHMTLAAMFEPGNNPGYKKLANNARDLIVSWSKNDWYESSTGES